MLHRYEEIILPNIIPDMDIAASKIYLLYQYGYSADELLRDPINLYVNHGEQFPEVINNLNIRNMCNLLNPNIEQGMFLRYNAVLPTVANKIPYENLISVLFELYAVILLKYKLGLIMYFNKLKHTLMCEGVFNPHIFIQAIFGEDGKDLLMHSNYVIMRVYVTIGG